MTTTRLHYSWLSVHDDEIALIDTEPGPVPDAMLQYTIFREIFPTLESWLASSRSGSDVFTSGNSFICYDPEDLNVRVSPDFYLAFGVDAETILKRRLYLPWEVGKSPDFVLEVASESTARYDMFEKRDIYRRIGVLEYWRFDATGGEYYDYALAGDRLIDGEYVPIDVVEEGADVMLRGSSEVLGLYLCWSDGELKFYDPDSGEYLRGIWDEIDLRLSAESDKEVAEHERRIAEYEKHIAEEQRRIAEEQRRTAEERNRVLESRNAELESELRRLRGEGSGDV